MSHRPHMSRPYMSHHVTNIDEFGTILRGPNNEVFLPPGLFESIEDEVKNLESRTCHENIPFVYLFSLIFC